MKPAVKLVILPVEDGSISAQVLIIIVPNCQKKKILYILLYWTECDLLYCGLL